MLDEIDGDCWEDFVDVAEDYEVDPITIGQFTIVAQERKGYI